MVFSKVVFLGSWQDSCSVEAYLVSGVMTFLQLADCCASHTVRHSASVPAEKFWWSTSFSSLNGPDSHMHSSWEWRWMCMELFVPKIWTGDWTKDIWQALKLYFVEKFILSIFVLKYIWLLIVFLSNSLLCTLPQPDRILEYATTADNESNISDWLFSLQYDRL